MSDRFDHWQQDDIDPRELAVVADTAERLRLHLEEAEVRAAIDAVNRPRVASSKIQATVLAHATDLRFSNEKSGLFAKYKTPGLRPDYYLPLPDFASGIIFEVERGKTTINNMDLLDLWKCHICAEAHHLFLMVPLLLRQNDTRKSTKPFDYVRKRLPSFFESGNYTNVRTCWLFGY